MRHRHVGQAHSGARLPTAQALGDDQSKDFSDLAHDGSGSGHPHLSLDVCCDCPTQDAPPSLPHAAAPIVSFTLIQFDRNPHRNSHIPLPVQPNRARPTRSLTRLPFGAAQIASCYGLQLCVSSLRRPALTERSLATELLWRLARAGLTPAGRSALHWAHSGLATLPSILERPLELLVERLLLKSCGLEPAVCRRSQHPE